MRRKKAAKHRSVAQMVGSRKITSEKRRFESCHFDNTNPRKGGELIAKSLSAAVIKKYDRQQI